MAESWAKVRQTLPPWIRKSAGDYAAIQTVRERVQEAGIWTVCTEANCPNLTECWAEKHCTFLILGNECTRWCGYCSVPKALRPTLQDFAPERAEVVRAIQQLGARYVVLTSPNRDDLPLGGARAWADQIAAIRAQCPGVQVEVLIPDFGFDPAAWEQVIGAGITVLGHNVEAVPALYPKVRAHGDFSAALDMLAWARQAHPDVCTKTALILGMGETGEQVREALEAITAAGVDILVLGQYLRPTPKQHPVSRFLPPAEFDSWRQTALALGIPVVLAGPFVRSSYKAREAWQQASSARQTAPVTRLQPGHS